MSIPPDLRYTAEHEWVKADADGNVHIGITAFAQEQLGDVVYVELPKVGASLTAMQPFGVVESVKAASDLYSPLTGSVVAVNPALSDTPELVNTDPYGEGWMIVLAPAKAEELDGLMTAQAYSAHVAAG
ncbi:MAG: glycine cleavage system protein GcvH [Ardenticatenales bacterium]